MIRNPHLCQVLGQMGGVMFATVATYALVQSVMTVLAFPFLVVFARRRAPGYRLRDLLRFTLDTFERVHE